MLLEHKALVHLKSALSPIEPSRQGAAATIGLLSHSGLNPTQQMPEVCHLLVRLLDLTAAGFFWSNREGDMLDAWCTDPSFLSFKTLMSCRKYQESGNRTWPTFQENVLVGPMAGYLLPFQNARFYASPHFHEVFVPAGVRHIIDVVLHDGERPYGALLLMRSASQGPFTPDERRFLEQLIPIANRAFTIPAAADTQYAEKEISGFALVGADGRYKSMSEEARRTVWMLTHSVPGSFADPADPPIESHLENLVAEYAENIATVRKNGVIMENRWGRFQLALERESKSGNIIVSLGRKLPLAAQLAFHLSRLHLPPVRQMVAWLLAQNHTRAQVAVALGVSQETVASHVKLIYEETGASSSHGLLFKLAA